jgi:serine/threonine protein kinase
MSCQLGQTLTNPDTGRTYQLIRLVSSGKCGDVYAAKSPNFSQPVAIKVVLKLDSYQRERMAYKIIAAKSSGDGFIALYDAFVDKSTHHGVIVSELMDSDLSRTVVPTHDIPTLFGSLIKAVSQLHRYGLVHRDITLNNIVFCGSTYKLCDLSHVCGHHSHPFIPSCSQMSSVDGIMSSQQRNDQAFKREMDYDVFQLGQVLASVILGYYPNEYINLSTDEPYPNVEPSEISGHALMVLLRHMLHPKDRWTSSQLQSYFEENFQPNSSN